jgi:uncharacterized membrane protein
MTRAEFIRELDQLLSELPDKERLDILADYTEFFLKGMQNGKHEEEIAAALGSPSLIASEILASYHHSRIQADAKIPKASRLILVGAALGFINLVFVLGPFLGLVGVMVGFYAASFALLISPVILFTDLVPPIGSHELAYVIFASMTALGLGGLLGIGMIFVTKWLYRLTVRYLQLNLRLIRGE